MIERVMSREVLPGCPAVGDYRAKLKSGARALVNANESSCPGCEVFSATPIVSSWRYIPGEGLRTKDSNDNSLTRMLGRSVRSDPHNSHVEGTFCEFALRVSDNNFCPVNDYYCRSHNLQRCIKPMQRNVFY